MSKALENARIAQTTRGNHPRETSATPEEQLERCRPATGLRYRARLNKILSGEYHKFDNHEVLVLE